MTNKKNIAEDKRKRFAALKKRLEEDPSPSPKPDPHDAKDHPGCIETWNEQDIEKRLSRLADDEDLCDEAFQSKHEALIWGELIATVEVIDSLRAR